MSIYQVTWVENGVIKREEFTSRAEAVTFGNWVASDSKPTIKKVAE